MKLYLEPEFLTQETWIAKGIFAPTLSNCTRVSRAVTRGTKA